MTKAAVKKGDPAVSDLFREMGRKGGRARAEKLTPKQRSDIAKRAVQTRIANAKAAAKNGT